ncbi:MAG: hypothetical protein AAGK05_14875, partial [Pseudomonadota bacterium]
ISLCTLYTVENNLDNLSAFHDVDPDENFINQMFSSNGRSLYYSFSNLREVVQNLPYSASFCFRKIVIQTYNPYHSQKQIYYIHHTFTDQSPLLMTLGSENAACLKFLLRVISATEELYQTQKSHNRHRADTTVYGQESRLSVLPAQVISDTVHGSRLPFGLMIPVQPNVLKTMLC